jgi:transcription-repair coupling factor (superfamily II helicase)
MSVKLPFSSSKPSPLALFLQNKLIPENKYLLGQKSWWGQLYGSALPLVISQLAKKQQRFVLLITADVTSAQQLSHELKFFLANSDIDIPILNLPDWEMLPYDHFSPHQDIVSERLSSLYQLSRQKSGILIVPVHSLMQQLPPVDYIEDNTLIIKQGTQINIDDFRLDMSKKGYRYVNTVYEHGEFSVRGSLIDIFPMGSTKPYRLDLFDDELETIKTFDIESQRSQEEVKAINMMPAREFPTNKEAIELFRKQYREQIGGDLLSSHIYSDISEGVIPAGIENYIPLFFNHTSTLFDYLPKDTISCYFHDLHADAEQFINDVKFRYEQYRHDINRPLLEPGKLFLTVEGLFNGFASFHSIVYQSFEYNNKDGVTNFSSKIPEPVQIDNQTSHPFEKIKQLISTTINSSSTNNKGKILFVCETPGRRESLLDLLKAQKIYPKTVTSYRHFIDSDLDMGITTGYLGNGLTFNNPDLIIIAENQLYGDQVMQRRRRRQRSNNNRNEDIVINSLAELQIGAPVVHEDNGVGRYMGLVTIAVDEQQTEFLLLEYQGGDKLYVPVSSLHLISRYTGANPDTAPLHKLGSGQWEKAKRKAKEKIRDVAAELLDIYAQREAQKGFIYPLNDRDYQQFCSAFPFEETPDQQQAIEQVIGDMTSSKPMDRLVCGDVGFGKTEVAMRAAYIAVQGGKQVAILVPTTLLSQQHTENFQDRFAELPVKIAGLSRFQTNKEQKLILNELNKGTIDIIIGTHKLLQKDIKFNELGLLIIDEEHRFGVRQKEQFKKFRNKVDILTMTATPIPRTLNMSLAGIRDFSIIATPPAKRLAIKTFVHEWSNETIREACHRELMRGGQVFVLHNKVDTIEKRARELNELLPDAKIDLAHGQMHEKQLEKVMGDFYHQRFNILVCTTIIETGIDIPTANTIIIERADRFGLAQLYQLRGRVGRSHHRAYAYLTVPPKKLMSADAVKRLEAIESIEDLGAGFTLATHDLEIRGAGELLGEGQSGQMQEIGFTLYTDLLDRAVKSLKEGKEPDLDKNTRLGTEIDLNIAALIPDDYLPDVHNRLIMYKRIANVKDDSEIKELQIEMIDRFGLLPDQIKNLFSITSLRLKSTPLGIIDISFSDTGGRIVFEETPNIDPMKIISLIQTKPNKFKLEGNNKLKLLEKISVAEKRIDYLDHLIDEQFQ